MPTCFWAWAAGHTQEATRAATYAHAIMHPHVYLAPALAKMTALQRFHPLERDCRWYPVRKVHQLFSALGGAMKLSSPVCTIRSIIAAWIITQRTMYFICQHRNSEDGTRSLDPASERTLGR
jgi:hypothetical protein